MPVHVSLHDVSPAKEREIDLALDLCHAEGLKPALLVVPDFHGEAPLERAPKFVDKLQALAKDGHEIFLHGFYHRSGYRPGAHVDAVETRTGRSPIEAAQHLFAQRVVSAGEAEFSDVTREEARARLEAGEKVLRDCSLPITGFVPPAWSMPRWMIEVLGERGYTYTEDHLRVYDPAHGTSRASVVLNFASRSVSRMFSTVAYCRAAKHARVLFPARVALHPGDMRIALLRNETKALLSWAKSDVATTAQALFAA